MEFQHFKEAHDAYMAAKANYYSAEESYLANHEFQKGDKVEFLGEFYYVFDVSASPTRPDVWLSLTKLTKAGKLPKRLISSKFTYSDRVIKVGRYGEDEDNDGVAASVDSDTEAADLLVS